MKRRLYPKCKSTGVDWLGDIPEQWGIKKLKWAYKSIGSGDGISPDDIDPTGKYPVYGGNGIMGYTEEFNADDDDIIIGRVGAKCGNVYLVSGKKWISDNALRLEIDKCDKRYLSQFLMARNLNQLANQNAQPLITGSMVGNQFIPIPPLSEQQAISAFLDRSTERIDTLVAKKKRLVEVLKEKRTALISHAVTRGLSELIQPADKEFAKWKKPVKLKSSGIDWLGDVPEHWEVRRLKHVSQLFGRIGFRGYTTDDLVDEMEGAITLSPSNMVDGELLLEKCTYISWGKYHESPEIIVNQNDVLIVKTGSTLGKIAYVRKLKHPMTINPQIAIFKKIEGLPRFLFHYIGAPYIQDKISISNTGSTIPTMTQETIMNYPVPLPPFPEQQAIAAFLDRETGKIDALIGKVEEAMKKLTEYRTALISAAVTGKMDVRRLVD